MASLTALNTSTGAVRPSVAHAQRGGNTAPTPHFDSILRAAPAYDDDDDDDAEYDYNEHLTTTEPPAPTSPQEPTISVADAIRPNLLNHASLHAFLDGNATLEDTIVGLQEKIHDETGRLQSRISQLKGLERDVVKAQEQRKGGAMLQLPKKKRLFKAAVEKAQSDRDAVKREVDELEQDVQKEKRLLADLELELVDYKRVEARLDALDNQVFNGPTPEYPEEDELEQKYHTALRTASRVRASVTQEKRALQALDKAHTLSQTLLSELLKALHIGMDVGVASNVKHKHALFTGTSPLFTSRATRGMVLRAKTLSGDLHTHYITARAIQKRITPLPKLEVIELTRMPDQRNKKVVNEVGLHRALEMSYAQSKAVKSHIERERQKSKSRQRLLRNHILGLEGEARMIWLNLRSKRREIIDNIRRLEPPPAHSEASPPAAAAISDTLASLRFALSEEPRPFNPSVPPSAEASQRPSLSASHPPPYRRELASQSSLGIAFPPLTSTTSGTLADLAASSDWQAREQHRLLTIPSAFRGQIDRDSTARSRNIILRVAAEVGSALDDDDLTAVGHIDTPDEEELPGFQLTFMA